ncbi:transmembrane protein, putative [Medicago truncatula]|uniref:Transmembrane protein, putative n=1 Tax=Medicago truncatula TaxID=3880 RepID=A0A072TI21_MEDTR|nr:transmembrane protein, putative [Medicago truncatula]
MVDHRWCFWDAGSIVVGFLFGVLYRLQFRLYRCWLSVSGFMSALVPDLCWWVVFVACLHRFERSVEICMSQDVTCASLPVLVHFSPVGMLCSKKLYSS